MKDYNKTLWEDDITLVDARKLNNIEQQVDSITDKISEVESNLNKNIDAIDQACTAITGEKFNSIDERIDSEIERLNKKIDVSMLKQELSENHIIDNTVKGTTIDMNIEGITLQNIFTTLSSKLILGNTVLENETFVVTPVEGKYPTLYDENGAYKANTNYTIVLDILENTLQSSSRDKYLYFGNATNESVLGSTLYKFDISDGKKGRFVQTVKTIPSFSTLTRNLGLKMYMNNNYTDGKIKFQLMVIETSTLNNYIPDYFKDIKSFGQKENNEIKILSNGKNIFNKINIKKFNSNFYYEESFKQNGDFYVSCNINKPIYIKAKDSNGNILKDQIVNNSSVYQFPENTKILRIDFYGTKEWTQNDINNLKLQIEKGTVATSYEPYQEDKKNVLLNKYGFDFGLNGIFDKKDELDYIQKKAIKRINKYIITGNENFVGDLRENYLYISMTINDCKPGSGNEAICSHFPYIDGLWNKDDMKVKDKEGFDFSGNNILSFQIATKRLETPDTTGFKKYFKKLYDQGTPVEVYYELLNPIIKELKDDMNIKTYDKKTYIEFDNNIQGENSFKVPIDVKETLSTLKKENEDIKTILNSILETLNKK